MKFLHISDLHLGKIVNEISMIEDQKYILDELVNMAEDKAVNAVLISGDIYDRSIPPENAVRLFDDFLYMLVKKRIAVIAISGNHDSDERLNFGSRLMAGDGVYITGRYDGKMPKVVLEDEYGKVNFYMLPFMKNSIAEYFFPEDEIHTYQDAVKCAIAHTDIDTSERNCILSHQFVTFGTVDPELSGSENSIMNVGDVERIGSSVYDAFDYCALGHIHKPQQIGTETVRYSGSPLKYSLKEINRDKSAVLVTLCEKGRVNIELLPLKPLREMRHIRGKLSDLTAAENVSDTDDYIYCTLTDETPVQDAMNIIREFYPNTMKIDYDNSHTRAMEKSDIETELAERGFDELMNGFYKSMMGTEPDEESWRILTEAAKEAGIV